MSDLTKAVEKLAEKSKDAEKPGDSMQYAQAALNLAHAFATLENAKK